MAKKKDDVAYQIIERDRLSPPGYLDDGRFITPGLKWDDEPETRRLPTLDEMRDLSDAELLKVLSYYGITEPYAMLQTQSMDYVRRMMPMASDTEINRAFAELMAKERRQLLGVTRRVSQQWSTLDAMQGNIQQEFIWLAEDDEATCDSCAPRSGEIDTWLGWKQRGMPGSETCRGGNLCRCDLLPFD